MDLRSQSIAALEEQLAAADPRQRGAIIGELGRRGRAGDASVIPLLVDLLSDAGAYVDETASDTLGSIGPVAVPALIELLRDTTRPWNARQWAARTFTAIRDPRAAEPMAEVVLDPGEDLRLRRVVALYLGRITSDVALEALSAVVTDPAADPELRNSAAAGLGETRDPRAFEPLAAVLRGEDVCYLSSHMEREIDRLRRMQSNASGTAGERFGEMIERAEAGRSLHVDVLSALRQLHDPRTLDLLLPMLATDDHVRRTAVAAALGDAGDQVVAPLLEALGSGDRRVSSGAIEALGFTEDARAVELLAAILQHDPDPGIRRVAAASLGFIPDDRALDPLMEGLRDDDVFVRQAAAQGLYQLALAGRIDARVVPTLEAVAEHDPGTIDGQFVVREAAARVVRELQRE